MSTTVRPVDPFTGAPLGPVRHVGQSPAPPADSTISVILEWVDGDPGRAAEALVAEELRPKPRVTLVSALTEILSADPSPEPDPESPDSTEPETPEPAEPITEETA